MLILQNKFMNKFVTSVTLEQCNPVKVPMVPNFHWKKSVLLQGLHNDVTNDVITDVTISMT